MSSFKTHLSHEELKMLGQGKASSTDLLLHVANCRECAVELASLPGGWAYLKRTFPSLHKLHEIPSWDNVDQVSLAAAHSSLDRALEVERAARELLKREPLAKAKLLLLNLSAWRHLGAVQAVLSESRKSFHKDPGRSEELARLALTLTSRLDEEQEFPSAALSAEALGWGYLGNALRIRAQFPEAETAINRGLTLLEQATFSTEPTNVELLDLLVSLWKDQEEYVKALRTASRARNLYLRLEDTAGMLSMDLQKGVILHLLGRPEDAARTLRRVSQQLAGEGSPLEFGAKLNLALAVVELPGGVREAASLLPFLKRVAKELGEEISLAKVYFVEAMVHQKQERGEAAIAYYSKAKDIFLRYDLPNHAAVAGLEIAKVQITLGEWANAARLATLVHQIFSTVGGSKRIRQSHRVFVEALQGQSATIQMAEELIEAVRRYMGPRRRP